MILDTDLMGVGRGRVGSVQFKNYEKKTLSLLPLIHLNLSILFFELQSVYLIPINFRLPLIFVRECTKIRGTEKVQLFGCTKIKGTEIISKPFDPPIFKT